MHRHYPLLSLALFTLAALLSIQGRLRAGPSANHLPAGLAPQEQEAIHDAVPDRLDQQAVVVQQESVV